MIDANGRQYDDVAASKAAKKLRDNLQDIHRLIMTYEPEDEGVALATYAKKMIDSAVKQVREYFAETFIVQRRGDIDERRGFVSEVVAEDVADAIADEVADGD